jgi:hypothetical protein
VCHGKILEVRNTCKSPTTHWNNATFGQRRNALGASADPPPTCTTRSRRARTHHAMQRGICVWWPPQPPTITNLCTAERHPCESRAGHHAPYNLHCSHQRARVAHSSATPPQPWLRPLPCEAPTDAGVRSLQHFHIGNQVCVAGWRTEGGVGESDASSQHTHRDAKCGLPWRLRHGLAVARDETHDACSAPPLARAARLSHKASHSPNYHPIKRLPLGTWNFVFNQVPSFCVVCAWVALPSVSKHVR